MSVNHILLIIIVILASIIIVVGGYFLFLKLVNTKKEKKIENIFDPTKLVEEESLMNVLDEKRNIEFGNPINNTERFINNSQEVTMVNKEGPSNLSQEQKVNPFGVDMTLHTKDNTPIVSDLQVQNNNNNKFFG